MTQYFLFLIEASISMVLLYIVYFIFLRHETIHGVKRFYLLSSLVISFVIPILPNANLTNDISNTANFQRAENSIISESHDNFERVVFGQQDQTVIYNQNHHPKTLLQILAILYFLGVVFMLIRLLTDFYYILNIVKNNPGKSYRKYILIKLSGNYPTFSFFKYIFLNEKGLSDIDKNNMLSHEETHTRQGHSFDVLFIELCKIILWFNPVISSYKNSIVKVHECLADEFVIISRSVHIEDYQSLLLNQYLSNFKIRLTQPFNFSLIKFRIAMMTKSKSKWWAKYKVIIALPIIILSLVAFTKNRTETSNGHSSANSQLNQLELFKQFDGTWTYVKSKDTTYTVEYTLFGDSLKSTLKYETNGKIYAEHKGNFAFNKESDKMIGFMMESNRPIAIYFITNNICETGPIVANSNPLKVMAFRKCEFKSPNSFSVSLLVKDKYVNEEIYTRIKE